MPMRLVGTGSLSAYRGNGPRGISNVVHDSRARPKPPPRDRTRREGCTSGDVEWKDAKVEVPVTVRPIAEGGTLAGGIHLNTSDDEL